MKKSTDEAPERRGKYSNSGYNSPIDATLDIIGGKYKVSILYNLRNDPLRFGQLRPLVPPVTTATLFSSEAFILDSFILVSIFCTRLIPLHQARRQCLRS